MPSSQGPKTRSEGQENVLKSPVSESHGDKLSRKNADRRAFHRVPGEGRQKAKKKKKTELKGIKIQGGFEKKHGKSASMGDGLGRRWSGIKYQNLDQGQERGRSSRGATVKGNHGPRKLPLKKKGRYTQFVARLLPQRVRGPLAGLGGPTEEKISRTGNR